MNNEVTIRFAERMKQLPPYLFGMINKIKMEKRWQGIDIIDLGMGNPMDPTPERVTEKLCEVAVDPKTHRYPVAGGMKNLKREIALYYKRKYGVELTGEDDVICTIGSQGRALSSLSGSTRSGGYGAGGLHPSFRSMSMPRSLPGQAFIRFSARFGGGVSCAR